tara:strand:+ start:848 stop:1351 length:504 start_codon:yes stop_codon:yes gene_type:complete
VSDIEEIAMTKSRTTGTALAARLRERMLVNGEGVTALSKRLGISQSYMSELLSGDRPLHSLSDNVIREIGAYLGLPPVVCFLLTGKLKHADFMAPPTSYATALNEAMDAVATSKEAIEAAVIAKDLKALPEPIKLLLVLLFESRQANDLLCARRWQWAGTIEPNSTK